MRLKRTRALSMAEEEEETLQWVRRKIAKNVETNANIEEHAKITACQAIQTEIKDNLAERSRLKECIEKARTNIKNEEAGLDDLDIQEALATNSLAEIEIRQQKLENARQDSLKTLASILASIKAKRKKIAEHTSSLQKWNQEVLDSKSRLIELEEDLG